MTRAAKLAISGIAMVLSGFTINEATQALDGRWVADDGGKRTLAVSAKTGNAVYGVNGQSLAAPFRIIDTTDRTAVVLIGSRRVRIDFQDDPKAIGLTDEEDDVTWPMRRIP